MTDEKDLYKMTIRVENCSSKTPDEIIREAYEKFLFQIAKKLFIDMDIDDSELLEGELNGNS